MGHGGQDGFKASSDGKAVGASLAPEDSWIAKTDLDAFQQDVTALGKQLADGQGPEDVDHLNKIIAWSNACCIVGLLSMWMYPNPITVFALSSWTLSRWTMIGHHICHGGYDKLKCGKSRFKFAVGGLLARVTDWFDWFLPEAWNVEHNNMHHY